MRSLRRLLCSADRSGNGPSGELCRLFTSAIVCQEGEDGVREAPSSIMLVPAAGRDGLVRARDGRVFSVDRDALIEAAKQNGADLMLDRDHESIFSLGAVPAAGWILHETVRRSGRGKNAAIVADVIWTEEGRADVEGLRFRFISPAFDPRAMSIEERGSREVLRVGALLNAGIVNQPALRMPALAKQEQAMDRTKIAEALGLSPDASEEEILAACSTAADAEAKIEESIPVAQYQALATQLAELRSDHERLVAKNAERDAADLVATALREERITPAEAETLAPLAAADPSMFRRIVDARVPGMFSSKPTASTAPAEPPVKQAPGVSDLTPEERHVCKCLGLSETEYLEQKKADAAKEG